MPTKRQMVMVLMTVTGFQLVLGGAKLWAARTLGEGNQGIARPVAEGVNIL